MENKDYNHFADKFKKAFGIEVEVIFFSTKFSELKEFVKKLMGDLLIRRNDNMSTKEKYEIDWDQYPDHFKMYTFLSGQDEAVKNMLVSSELINHEFVMVVSANAVLKLTTTDFVAKYREVSLLDDQSTMVFSENGKLFMEFLDEGTQVLISNFLIENNDLRNTHEF